MHVVFDIFIVNIVELCTCNTVLLCLKHKLNFNKWIFILNTFFSTIPTAKFLVQATILVPQLLH